MVDIRKRTTDDSELTPHSGPRRRLGGGGAAPPPRGIDPFRPPRPGRGSPSPPHSLVPSFGRGADSPTVRRHLLHRNDGRKCVSFVLFFQPDEYVWFWVWCSLIFF